MSKRMVEPDAGNLTPAQEVLLQKLVAKRGRVLTPYKIWLQAPGLAEGMEVLGTHLNTASSLSHAEREIIILATAVYWGSPFVITAHTRHAREAGLAEDAIAALLASQPVPVDGARLKAVARFTSISLAGGGTDDATFDDIATAIGRGSLAEAVALIGYFTSVAIAMRLHDMQPKQT